MKNLLWLFLVLSPRASAQDSITWKEITTRFKSKSPSVYIVARGTTRKAGLIAARFNIADSNITHVGIGFIKNDALSIYNVIDQYPGSSALISDSLESFVSGRDVFYLGIWESRLSPAEYKTLVEYCELRSKRKIYFDAFFNIGTDDTLYCSEFCAEVLRITNETKFNFKPRKISLDQSFYESILGRKELIYFPVDFFETNKSFTKIFEHRFMK